MYAILSALHPPERNTQRPSKYKEHIKNLNFDAIYFPHNIKDTPRFEKKTTSK